MSNQVSFIRDDAQRKTFWGKAHTLLKSTPEKERAALLHKIFGVESLNDLHPDITIERALESVRGYVEFQAITEPEASIPPAPSITHSESPVVVYPKEDGGIEFNGRVYSVTLRVGGTAEMAFALLQEWDRLFTHPDIKFVTRTRPMATPPAPIAPVSIPPKTFLPEATTDEPQWIPIYKIARVTNQDGSTQGIGLKTKAKGDYADCTLWANKYNEDLIKQLSALTGIDFNTLPITNPLPTFQVVNVEGVFAESEKNGKKYLNCKKLRAAPPPPAMPF